MHRLSSSAASFMLFWVKYSNNPYNDWLPMESSTLLQ